MENKLTNVEEIKAKCPNLTDQHIKETIELFNTFDFDEEGIVEEIQVIATMLMAMGCDVTRQKIIDLYQELFQ